MSPAAKSEYEVSEFRYRDFPFVIEPPIRLSTNVNPVAQLVIVSFLREQYGLENTAEIEYRIEDVLDRVGYTGSITDSREVRKLEKLERIISTWLPGHDVVAKYIH